MNRIKEARTIPQELDIRRPKDVGEAVRIAVAGEPIAFAGGTLYGLGGTPKAFKGKISEIKKRNFYEDPPSALASWEAIKQAVDWEKLASPQEEKTRLQKTIKELWGGEAPIHIIAPVTQEAQRDLPFTRRVTLENGNTVKTQAFLCVASLPEMRDFVREFERKTGGSIFLVTSANLPGHQPYTTSREVVENLGEVPAILKSPDLDSGMPTVRVRSELQGCSYTMIDITHLAEGRVDVRRLGTHWSLQLDRALSSNGVTPEINFGTLGLEAILTTQPELITIPPIR